MQHVFKDTTLFSHYPTGKLFLAEASDLGLVEEIPRTISLTNPRTRNTVKFTYSRTTKDDEGDVMFWTYVVDHESVRMWPKTAGYTLKVLND